MTKNSEETMGLTAEEEKQRQIYLKLMHYYIEHKHPDSEEMAKKGFLNVGISHYDLTVQLTGALSKNKPPERHTISKYVKFLLSQECIVRKGNGPPNNKTIYFINFAKVAEHCMDLNRKTWRFNAAKQKKSATLTPETGAEQPKTSDDKSNSTANSSTNSFP